MSSYACPNDPPCGHGSMFHDIEDAYDEVPSCCAEGCACGKNLMLTDRQRADYYATGKLRA